MACCPCVSKIIFTFTPVRKSFLFDFSRFFFQSSDSVHVAKRHGPNRTLPLRQIFCTCLEANCPRHRQHIGFIALKSFFLQNFQFFLQTFPLNSQVRSSYAVFHHQILFAFNFSKCASSDLCLIASLVLKFLPFQ